MYFSHSPISSDVPDSLLTLAILSIMETGQMIEWQDLDKRRYYIIGPSVFVCVRAVLYPINLIKVHLFMQQGNSLYSGATDAFRKILRREGIRGLYRGFTVSLLGMASGQLYITTYELTRSRLPGYSTEFKGLVAGTCATIMGQLLTVPVDVVSQHMMMEGQEKLGQRMASSKAKPSQYILVKNTDYVLPRQAQRGVRSAYHIVRDILHREGFHGLHKGYSVSLLTYAPNSALFWSTYSMLFRWGMESGWGEPLPLPLMQASCGVVGGVTSAALTNPLDVLRTRYQVRGCTYVVLL